MYYFYSISILKDTVKYDCGDIYGYVSEKLKLILSNVDIGLHCVFAKELSIPYQHIMVRVTYNNYEIEMDKLILEIINYILISKDNKNTYEVKLIKEVKDEIFNKVVKRSKSIEYFTEEVLLDNIPNNDIVEMYNHYLKKIKSEGEDLIIIDPYILKNSNSNYINLLLNILKKAKAKTYTIITNHNNINNTAKNNILKEIPDIKIISTKRIHDRFWICNRKTGFYVGSSLNGIGRKLTLINLLKKSEVSTIVKYLMELSIINSKS